MRILATIVILVVLIAISVAYAIKTWNRIVFTFAFKGIDLSTINIQALLASGQTNARLLLGVNIKNMNGFSIPFDKMKVWLNYDGVLIAESSGYLYAQSFNLPANGEIDVTDYVNVYINQASGKLVKEAVAKNNPKVNYTVKITVFGLRLTYSDFFEAKI